MELARTLSNLDGYMMTRVHHGHRAHGGRAAVGGRRVWDAQGRCVIWCEQRADRLPDYIRRGPFEPVRSDLVHGQDGPIRIMHKDGVRDALEEETKLCF